MLLWSLRHSPIIHLCLMAEPTSTLILIRSSSDQSTDHSLSTNPWSRSPMWSSDVGYNNRSIEISVSTINVQFCPCSQLCPSKMKPAPRPRRGPTGRATPATSASSWAAPPRGPAPLASASAVSVNIWILNRIQMVNSLINSQLYVRGHNECERDLFPESGIFLNIQRVNPGIV